MQDDLFFPDKNEDGFLTLKITSLGAQGEGIALDSQGNKIYIPKVLPGETIIGKPALRRGSQRICRVESIQEPAADRAAAFCPVYERCGGCALQHMTKDAYRAFKKSNADHLLGQFISTDNISWEFFGEQGQRRRVSLSYRNDNGGLKLGFFMQQSHYLVGIDSCPLLTEPLNKLIEPLTTFLSQITERRDEGFVHLTDTATGVDCSWSPHKYKKKVIDGDLWKKWTQFGMEHNLAQITRAGKELVACFRTPMIDISGKLLRFPSAAFLQPSQNSQVSMQQAMLTLLKDGGYIKPGVPAKSLDLFCGLGTFTIPLSSFGTVTSIDCAGQSLASLKEHQGNNLTILERDLMGSPLSAKDLEGFDLIVLDPPRAGAYTQVQTIATSFKGPVVMISCDLATAARDAQEMIAGGYTLSQCLLFDQFPYTAHLEGMLFFERI